MAMTLRVVVPPHPLIAHWLTMLRNRTTPAALYATGLEELGRWLTYEALRDWLPYRFEEVQTHQTTTQGQVIENSVPLLAIPISRGGFELWQGARRVLPNAELCFKGVPDMVAENAGIVVYIDQIKSGQELLSSLQLLYEQNISPKRIRIITALASSPGLKNIGEQLPDLNIYAACIDPELTEFGEISPGIGNPSLRMKNKTQGLT